MLTEACAVLARGTMNSYLVQFEDGFTAVTSRNAALPPKNAAATALKMAMVVLLLC